MSKRWLASLLLVVVVVLAACGGADDESATEAEAPSDQAGAAAAEAGKAASQSRAADGRAGGDDGAGGGTGGPGFQAAAPESDAVQQPLPELPPVTEGGPGNRVIKNISLEVEIEEEQFQRQFALAGSVAEQFGGFVTNSQVSETEGKLASGTLTIRVPANRFEAAVNRLKELGEVKAEDRSGQDVTREFVDLEARLRHAKTEESFYLRLMDEAEGISDMIQIQSQLSGVQMRIEQIQGQLNYLNDQTSFSTITVRLYEPGAPSGPPKGLARAWEGAVDGFQSVIGGLVVTAGWLAPFALLALVGLLVFRVRSRPKLPAAEVPPPAQT